MNPIPCGENRPAAFYRIRCRIVWAVLAGLTGLFLAAGAAADPAAGIRFLHSGDGRIHLVGEKNGARFEGDYRRAGGGYDPEAVSAICRVFGAPCTGPDTKVSIRLVEFIDFLQDRFNPEAVITIVSGYRSPAYNAHIREKGALAAKASLHQYGMAADLVMGGVPSRAVWDEVRRIGFGGAGYYHGETVHVDTGPARSWDEATSGVGSGLSDDNKLIGLVTDYDIYRPGDPVTLKFVRMTAFPIGVEPHFSLKRLPEGKAAAGATTVIPSYSGRSGLCPEFADISQMAGIRIRLPGNLAPGRYVISARFCNKKWPKMPAGIDTAPINVTGP
jgi:uncharacterized protein YcbK (DUF882 family)